MKNLNEQNKIELMTAICKIVKRERLKQREIAELLNIKQPRVSDLIAKKHDRFSIDILMGYMELFGYSITFKGVETVKGKPLKANVEKVSADYKKLLSE